MIFVSLVKDFYATDVKKLEALFESICLDLREAYLEGIALPDGSKVHLVPIGVKGDWPFLDIHLKW